MHYNISLLMSVAIYLLVGWEMLSADYNLLMLTKCISKKTFWRYVGNFEQVLASWSEVESMLGELFAFSSHNYVNDVKWFEIKNCKPVRLPRGHLLVQGQQWKHQNNVWNIFKVNNKTWEWREWRQLFFLSEI